MSLWQLPTAVKLGLENYPIHTDYRDILEIFSYLQDETLPEFVRWEIVLALFYRQPVPDDLRAEAMEQFCRFVSCGQEAEPGPKLLDWEQDAQDIVADVNKVAGQEIRALSYLHWWTFLSWFHSIGEGNLSTLISIRDKLRRGKKLEGFEREYYRRNRRRVEMGKNTPPRNWRSRRDYRNY